MRQILAGIGVTLVLLLGAALAAGNYDGTWIGTVESASARCPSGTITMQILGNDITGAFGLGGARVPFRGTVADEGSVTVSYNYPSHSVSGSLTGKVTGGNFVGKFESIYQTTGSDCVRNVTAKHA
jgi:hypothetical protein